MTRAPQQRTYDPSEAVDFVVVGSGAAGGIVASELSAAGFDVVVLEGGPWRESTDFGHDELAHWFLGELTGNLVDHPQTFRQDEESAAERRFDVPPAIFARGVGGSSVHFSGNYWRLRPVDFRERSLLGPISGTDLDDWPLTYEELEPYYARVDWEIGVSGAPGPNDPPRSRPYPVPPMPVKSSGVLFERGCREVGVTAQPAPVAILSRSHDGRSGCIHCGRCMAFGCEAGAKSSTLVTVIPRALATGRCEIRADSTVMRVETDDRGRCTGVVYVDAEGREMRQAARSVVLSCNGAETPRLLFLSESTRFPDGLANGSGLVGRRLMFNAHSEAFAEFDEPLNEYKSIQVTRISHDFYEADPARGFYGGGGLEARMIPGPLLYPLFNTPPDEPRWGAGFKAAVRRGFTRTMEIAGSGTSLPVESNSVSLDPDHTDVHGRPALRITYRDHEDDLANVTFLQDRAVEILEAAGARRVWRMPVEAQNIGAHLLGTCRMGDDPERSVVDRHHRSHEVPNLFICDGSSMVTSGRGQPTMTIQALAFRAAEHIARAARAGEV